VRRLPSGALGPIGHLGDGGYPHGKGGVCWLRVHAHSDHCQGRLSRQNAAGAEQYAHRAGSEVDDDQIGLPVVRHVGHIVRGRVVARREQRGYGPHVPNDWASSKPTELMF
jgi:hypothetical protein